jgi:hypothetical protein
MTHEMVRLFHSRGRCRQAGGARKKTSAPTLPLVHATKCTFFLASTTRVQCGDLVQRNRVMGSWPETPVTLSVRANLVATFDQQRRGISSLQECLFGHFMLAQSARRFEITEKVVN